MTWDPALNALRDALADLYETQEAARQLAGDSGLDLRKIDFSGKAAKVLTSLLTQAFNNGQVEEVIQAAKKRYSKSESLAEAAEHWSLHKAQRLEPGAPPEKASVIGGDRITVGDISGGKGIAIGRSARATVTEGLGGEEIARLFAEAYERIEARPADPDVDKQELTETVEKIQGEVARAEEANPKKLERWLKFLAGMAPDIFEVVASSLTSPAAGIAAVVRNVAERAQKEAGGA